MSASRYQPPKMLLRIHWRSKMTAWNLTLQILPTGVAILLISGLLRAAGGTFDPPHHLLNPIGQLARSLSLPQRQRQHQVSCASDGGGLRAPLLIQPDPGVPVLPLSSRIGIHVSPWKHKIAILKAIRVDFKQHQQNSRKGISITALLCVFGSLGASPGPDSLDRETTFLLQA